MATDRGAAVAAATRIKQGVERRDSNEYMADYLSRDAWLVADHVLGATPAVVPVDMGGEPDNPVSPEFLRLVGFADPTTNGNVWTVQDIDGRELKYTFVGDDGEPKCNIIDDEGEGINWPAPETEGDLLELCRLGRFPAELPVS